MLMCIGGHDVVAVAPEPAPPDLNRHRTRGETPPHCAGSLANNGRQSQEAAEVQRSLGRKAEQPCRMTGNVCD